MRTIVSIVIFFFICKNATCCSCGSIGRITVQKFNSYDWIFIGTLISEIKSDNSYYQYRRKCIYKIATAYKGTTVGDTVYVYDAHDGASCGLGRLTIGRNYLIYANGNEKKCTSDCSRTTRVPHHRWPADSATINKLAKMTSFGRIYDTLRTNFHADTLFLNMYMLNIRKTNIQDFYDENGKISATGRYHNGQPEGFWNYFENGNMDSKGKYVNGKKDSFWVESSFDKCINISEYKAGEFTFREVDLCDGKVRKKSEPMNNGQQWIKYRYHSNGQPRYIEYCNPPKRDSNNRLQDAEADGPFKMFNTQGVVLQKGIYNDGLSTGHWEYYYENGILRMEGDYEQGKKTGIWKIYYSNKKVKAIGEYKNDKKVGTWKYFDDNGNKIAPDPTLIVEDEDWFTYSGEVNYQLSD